MLKHHFILVKANSMQQLSTCHSLEIVQDGVNVLINIDALTNLVCKFEDQQSADRPCSLLSMISTLITCTALFDFEGRRRRSEHVASNTNS